MEIEHAPHCTYRIRYHMVFVVKYRKAMIDREKMGFLKEILIEIGERYWFKFDAIGLFSCKKICSVESSTGLSSMPWE